MSPGVPVPVAQVDVFTDRPFAGNPAAVCLPEAAMEEARMAEIARELACPNTAFVVPRAAGDGYDLRWYTAGGVEVALCGHATLASAHVLYEQGRLGRATPARFHTQSGVLVTTLAGDGAIEMDFPAEVAVRVEDAPAALTAGLDADLVWVGRNRLDYVVEVADEAVLRRLAPDLPTLAQVETRGIVVTARAAGGLEEAGYDYALRFFAPRVGIPEDMVTGTAHCALGPYWRDRLGDRASFTAYQASPRGGYVGVRLAGDRVLVKGKAVTVLQGTLLG